MVFVKILNSKAVPTDETVGDVQMVPEGTYITAVVVDGEIRFYGSVDEDGLIQIANTISTTTYSETVVEAKNIIKSVGCLFLNNVQVSL
jgi:hypothetical protein